MRIAKNTVATIRAHDRPVLLALAIQSHRPDAPGAQIIKIIISKSADKCHLLTINMRYPTKSAMNGNAAPKYMNSTACVMDSGGEGLRMRSPDGVMPGCLVPPFVPGFRAVSFDGLHGDEPMTGMASRVKAASAGSAISVPG